MRKQSTFLKMMHPALVPLRESAFAVFPKLHDELLLNVAPSLALLAPVPGIVVTVLDGIVSLLIKKTVKWSE